MVEKARREEKDFMSQFGVTIPSSLEECREETEYDPIPTQWLDLNKGDQGSPQIRSRLLWKHHIAPALHPDDWNARFGHVWREGRT